MKKHDNSGDYSQFDNQNDDQSKDKRHLKFTDISIHHLKPLENRVTYWSDNFTGFGIRISPKGTKTWVYMYRLDGKQRHLSFGKFPRISLSEAMSKYLEAKRSVDYGIDPLDERANTIKKQEEELTVKELVALYLEFCKQTGKKKYREEELKFQKDLIPPFGNKKILEITPQDLSKLFHLMIIERRVPSAASHLFSYTRRLFNFAADLGLMRRRDNPCLDIKLNIPKKKRQRHLSLKEVYLLWNNLDNVPTSPIIRLAIKFMLCTVTRTIEVRQMKWSDVDFNERVWTLPNTKNGRAHRVYLGDLALKILKEARQYSDGQGYVFGSTQHYKTCGKIKGNLKPLSQWALSQPIRRHFEKLGIEEPFYPHDLRRTGATLIAGLFGRRDFAAMALNHTTNDVTDVYDQYVYDVEKKLAFEALNNAIEQIQSCEFIDKIPSLANLRERRVSAKTTNTKAHNSFDINTDFPNRSFDYQPYQIAYLTNTMD